jgi:dihydropteroate synthase
MRPRCTWRLRSRSLDLGDKTIVMGVVNVTPDSFSDGGWFFEPEQAIKHGLELLDEGADILDIGGESTRPGAFTAGDEGGTPVSEEEERQRVLPVIAGILHAKADAAISIDTYKASVARAAVTAGAEIVNDVSAFQWDPQMGAACAELQCGVVLMHTRGKPKDWRTLPAIDNILSTIEHDLANRIQVAFERGVARDRIVLDPGFGFGKNFDENFQLLAHFDRLQRLGFPLLAGASRKSFIGRAIEGRTAKDAPASRRLYGSVAAMVASILRGAHMVRVHDVRPAVEAAAVADAMLAAMESSGQ